MHSRPALLIQIPWTLTLDGLVGLDACHAVSVPGALGLGTVAVGIEFLSHALPYR